MWIAELSVIGIDAPAFAKLSTGTAPPSGGAKNVTVITATLPNRFHYAFVPIVADTPISQQRSVGKPARRRPKMDRNTESPWSWEEEAEWKADLEESEHDFLDGLIDVEELIDSAVEDATTSSRRGLASPREDPFERYLVTA